MPGWSADFDAWAADALARGDVDELADFRAARPACRTRTPPSSTSRRCSSPSAPPPTRRRRSTTAIDGYAIGLAKRSFQAA